MNNTMRSLVVDKDGTLHIKIFPIPSISPYQALVKMEACGVCSGTDSKIIHGKFKDIKNYPTSLGHEGVGIVTEIGSKVTTFKVGDRVMLPFLEEANMPKGYHTSWGAFSEYGVVGDAPALIKDGKGSGSSEFSEGYYAQKNLGDISSLDGVMIVTFREVLAACKRFGFAPNDPIVIFGAGPVGLTYTKFAKLLGMGPIITIDVLDSKVEEALKAGADFVFNSKKTDVNVEVRKILPNGSPYVLDAVGISDIINQSMGLIEDGGKICCYGISANLSMELSWEHAPYNWTMEFQQMPSKLEEANAHRQIVSWIELGVLSPKEYISDIISFDNIIDGFKKVAEGKVMKKMIVQFDS